MVREEINDPHITLQIKNSNLLLAFIILLLNLTLLSSQMEALHIFLMSYISFDDEFLILGLKSIYRTYF